MTGSKGRVCRYVSNLTVNTLAMWVSICAGHTHHKLSMPDVYSACVQRTLCIMTRLCSPKIYYFCRSTWVVPLMSFSLELVLNEHMVAWTCDSLDEWNKREICQYENVTSTSEPIASIDTDENQSITHRKATEKGFDIFAKAKLWLLVAKTQCEIRGSVC